MPLSVSTRRFVALLSDMFPSVAAPDTADEEMVAAVKAAAADMKLELHPEQV